MVGCRNPPPRIPSYICCAKENVLHLAYGKFGGGPVAAVFVIVLFAVAALFLRYVRFGRYIYAVGDDHHGARLMGLPCSRVGGVA